MTQTLIAGVDEVGRGPLAGPVVASAVILDVHYPIEGLVDSKTLSHSKRLYFAEKIRQYALAWAIGQATVEEIDTYNILQATLIAMKRAVENLAQIPQRVLIDGQHRPVLNCPSQTLIKGDQLCPAISAASILAKTTRDAMMVELDKQYPEYGFAKHKGYGTAFHMQQLKTLGATPIHRLSFAPVKRVLKPESKNF